MRDLRIDAAWDAVRYTERHGSTENHRTEHLWVTRNRDDCIEADAKNQAVIEDVLCESFVGISAADKKISRASNTMRINGALISVLEYVYRVKAQAGPPIKLDDGTSIGLSINDSVIVLNSRRMVDGRGTFDRIRESIRECSGNLLIWPYDTALPNFVDLPDCFTVLAGAKDGGARWQRIRQNWIDCHPEVPRLPGDRLSNLQDCDKQEYGGMY
ncbi:hypothetical protein [Palleronia aestuarii]|uniref:hypothetical protein n=1 Tax=Palleronia aestuarii TaxID=568105 RepID=UPI001B86D9FE|nr:hypothetical protein [Palleronia aestuarii]